MRRAVAIGAFVVALFRALGAAQEPVEEDSIYADTISESALQTAPTPGHHRYWQVDLGVAFPVGTTRKFNAPQDIFFLDPAQAYTDYYRAGYSANFQFGVSTDEGYDAAVSLRITKVNYTNLATSLIQSNELGSEAEYSSYLFETQLSASRRVRPFFTREESLYFGVAVSLGSLEHYAARLQVPDEASFSVSLFAGDEIPLFRDPDEPWRMLTFRPQFEFTAIANDTRPRYTAITFGIRGYIQ